MPGKYTREEAEQALREAEPVVDATVRQLRYGGPAPMTSEDELTMRQLQLAELEQLKDINQMQQQPPAITAEELREHMDRINQYLDMTAQRQIPVDDLVLPSAPPLPTTRRLNLPRVPDYGRPSPKSKRK